jgi:glycosyltransferase involved in cell wall biosynthesis
MKVSGFSFIKNAVSFQYPIVEAIRSILPLCDEVIVAVGRSEDGTRELVSSIDPKVKILDTVWDESILEGGRVLAAETNKAFSAIGKDSDWCIYIQGDEVLHECGLEAVRSAMHRWKDNKKVDGLLFNYKHFYGSFDFVGTSSRWYRKEIRVIRNDKSFYSYKDAQGFRKADNQKLKVKPVDAWIYHYGWVREPKAMMAKWKNFGKLYLGQEWKDEVEKTFTGDFDYSGIDALEKFTGSHPMVMQERVKNMNWKFEYDISFNKIKLKDKLKDLLEKVTGKRPFDHNNFKEI